MILRVLPLRGSSAPVGFIYDATPDPVDGGLLAAASAFFSHQGHQVFHDQCPDLDEYCRASGVSLASVVPVDRLPDYLLSSGLEIMAVLRSPSPTDTTVGGMAFMAGYLSSLASGPPLVGASAGPSVGVLPSVVPPVPSSARFTGGSSAASAWLSAPPPASSLGGYAVLGGPPFPVSGGPVDPGGSPPPRRSSSSVFMGGSVLPSSTPVRNPYVSSSRHTDPGGFRGGFPPPSQSAPPVPPAPFARRPDPEEEVSLSPPSRRSSLPSSVSFGGHQSVSSSGGYHGGGSSSPSVGGYQDGRFSSSSSGGLGGRSSSVPSSGHPVDDSVGEATVDDLSDSTSRTSLRGGPPGAPARVSSPEVSLTPIPVPSDRFTLAPIKTGEDYLQQRDILLFWLRADGFSTGRTDDLLITDSRNALASQFWEGQLRTSLKDSPARFLFENTGTTYFGKGFEMLQVLEDHFRPSSISNSFTTLLALFNDTQGDKETIHEFRSRFEGHMGALSRSSVAIPPILQVMIFLRGMHSRYQDLLAQFASKHKDLSVATIDSIVGDAKFMDEFKLVGGKTKTGTPGASPRGPSVAAVATDKDGKEFRNPFEWLATYDSGFVKQRWQRSLRGGFYCAFCSGKEKHHPFKCPLLGDLGLKIIEIGGGKGGKASSGSCGSGAGTSGGSKPSSTPPAAAPAAVSPPPAVSDSGSASAPAGLTAAVEPEEVGDEDSAEDFRWYGDDDGEDY